MISTFPRTTDAGPDLLETCLVEDWRPSRHEIIRHYCGEPQDISEHIRAEQWFRNTTKAAKKYGAYRPYPIVFGYDPGSRPEPAYWRVSPTSRPDITKRILRYGFSMIRSEITQVEYQLIAGQGMGHLFNADDIMRGTVKMQGDSTRLFNMIHFADSVSVAA